jgi:hypothetical protein
LDPISFDILDDRIAVSLNLLVLPLDGRNHPLQPIAHTLHTSVTVGELKVLMCPGLFLIGCKHGGVCLFLRLKFLP